MHNKTNKNLALLLGGQFVSQLGDKFYALALAYWVLQTTGSPAQMGLMLFCSMAPAVILGFFTGGIVDRFDRKAVLVATDIVRGVAIVAAVVLHSLGALSLAAIVAIQVVLSAASAFFNPAVMAVLPQIVPEERLVKANSTSQFLSGAANIVGPVLGGLAVSAFGYLFVFAFNAASFFASALCEAALSLPPRADGQARKPVAESIREGYAYILSRKTIVALLGVVAAVHFFVGSVQVVMPVLANALAGDGAKNLGYIESAFGFGIVAAALALRLLNPKWKKETGMFGGLVALGAVQLAVGLLAATGVLSVLPFLILFFLLSAAVIVVSTNYTVILQQSIDNAMAGRVFGIVGSVGNFTLPVAILAFGCIVTKETIGIVTTLCGAAVLVVCAVLVLSYRSRKAAFTVLDSDTPSE